MLIPNWLANLISITFILMVVIILFFILNILINNLLQYRLKKILEKGLLHDDLNFSDFKNLQANLRLSDRNTYSALLNMKSTLDFSEDKRRGSLKPKLDELINEFNNNKPFSDLPEGLVKPLIDAKSKSLDPKVIDDLAEKISIHLKRRKKGEFFLMLATYVSLIAALISFFPNPLK